MAAEITADNWRDFAACLGEDPELFYAVGDSGPALLQIAEAKAVCRRCPVISDCLAWALTSGADSGWGVWGGLSEKERRALRDSQARKRRAKVTTIHPAAAAVDTKPEQVAS